MAIRRAPEPERHRSRFYVGLAAFTAVLAAFTLARNVRRHFVGAVTLYQVSSAPIGPNPQSWPVDHRTPANDDRFQAPTTDPGPNYLVRLPALANSDPVLVRGTLYVTGGVGRAGYLWALDPRTGRVRWTASLPNATYAEPIVAGGRVFVAEGNAAFPERAWAFLAFLQPSWDPATTPGTVRGTGPSGLYAFNAETGAVLWRFATRYAAQAPPTVAHGRVYLATGGRHLDVIAAETGRLLWRRPIPVYVSRSSPRLVGGAIDFGGAGPLAVLSIGQETHRLRWVTPIPYATGGVDDTPLAVAGGILYTASLGAPPKTQPGLGGNPTNSGAPWPPSPSAPHVAALWALSARSGRILWSHRLAVGTNPPYKETGTPMVHGARIFAGNALNGRFVALSRTTGTLMWSTWLNAPVTRPPVWVDHTILAITDRGTLYRLSAATGQVLARRSLGPFVNAYGPVVVDHTAFVTVNQPQGGYLAAVPLNSLWVRTGKRR